MFCTLLSDFVTSFTILVLNPTFLGIGILMTFFDGLWRHSIFDDVIKYCVSVMYKAEVTTFVKIAESFFSF